MPDVRIAWPVSMPASGKGPVLGCNECAVCVQENPAQMQLMRLR